MRALGVGSQLLLVRRPAALRAAALIAVALSTVVALAACDLAIAPPVPSQTPSPTALPSTGPDGSASGSAPLPSPSVSPSAVDGAPTASPASVTYTVASGDTLTSIARRFSTTARSIAFWNRATHPSLDPESPSYAPNRIEVGWILQLIPGTVVDEQALPSPSVTPQPTVSIGPSAVPSGEASVLVSNGSRQSNAVALTFDMGGRLDPALAIVDWLIANEVPATVFPTGATGSGTAIGRAVLARIKVHPELFSLGNHSWDHPDFTKLGAVAMTNELTRTEAAVAPLAGRSTQPFFRPPYGAVNVAVRNAVGGAGWRYTVMWDVDTIDWMPERDGGPTADDIVAKVVARARGGSIVLMHLGGYHTLEALPRVVEALRAHGLEPVTLGRLLGVDQPLS